MFYNLLNLMDWWMLTILSPFFMFISRCKKYGFSFRRLRTEDYIDLLIFLNLLNFIVKAYAPLCSLAGIIPDESGKLHNKSFDVGEGIKKMKRPNFSGRKLNPIGDEECSGEIINPIKYGQ